MKKLILSIILICFLAIPAYAFSPLVVCGGGVAASGGECDYVTGDYDFGYNGDQASGDTYGCLDNSPLAGSETGTAVSVNGLTGNGAEHSAQNNFLSFAKSNAWLEVDGSFYFKISASTGDNLVWEAYNPADEGGSPNDYVKVTITSDGSPYFSRTQSGTAIHFPHSQNIADNVWIHFEFNIDDGGNLCGTGKELAIRMDYWDGTNPGYDGDFDDANEGWECYTPGTDIAAMGSAPTNIYIGENLSGTGVNNTVYVDDLLINFR